ncbi:hypothetical protein D3C81_1169560 [compost metagenome]
MPATKPASTPTRPAMVSPAPWRKASTTACPPRARRQRGCLCWTAPACARWPWRIRYAPITWARKWPAGWTWWWPITTITSTPMPCCSAWPRPTNGGWRYWWTKRTTWSSAVAACTAPASIKASCLPCASANRRGWSVRWTASIGSGTRCTKSSARRIRLANSCRMPSYAPCSSASG